MDDLNRKLLCKLIVNRVLHQAVRDAIIKKYPGTEEDFIAIAQTISKSPEFEIACQNEADALVDKSQKFTLIFA